MLDLKWTIHFLQLKIVDVYMHVYTLFSKSYMYMYIADCRLAKICLFFFKDNSRSGIVWYTKPVDMILTTM